MAIITNRTQNRTLSIGGQFSDVDAISIADGSSESITFLVAEVLNLVHSFDVGHGVFDAVTWLRLDRHTVADEASHED